MIYLSLETSSIAPLRPLALAQVFRLPSRKISPTFALSVQSFVFQLHIRSIFYFYVLDSSNGISSPDDNSGCEEYTENTLIENSDPPIIVPVPGKSGYIFLLC